MSSRFTSRRSQNCAREFNATLLPCPFFFLWHDARERTRGHRVFVYVKRQSLIWTSRYAWNGSEFHSVPYGYSSALENG